MDKILVFDMDGTIADFYNVKGWKNYLDKGNPIPYIVAKPIYDMFSLNNLLELLKSQGWKVVIVSWVAKECDDDFKNAIRIAKTDWLDRYNFPYDELHIVKYGTTKANCVRKYDGRKILIDDNEKVRKGWNGETINANENILIDLTNLLVNE